MSICSLLLYRNTTFNLKVTLISSFVSSRHFCILWKFLNRSIMSFAVFFLSFWSTFDFLFLTIALARSSSSMLNRSGKNWHPNLVPDLKGKQSLTIKYNVSWRVFIDALYQSEKSTLYCYFCHELMLNSVKLFFYINRYNHVIFLLTLLIWWITSAYFWILKLALQFCNKPHLIMEYNSSNWLLNSIC